MLPPASVTSPKTSFWSGTFAARLLPLILLLTLARPSFGAEDQDGDFVFECTMEYYVQIDPLTQQTNYFPYQTFEGMKLLLHLDEYTDQEGGVVSAQFDIVSEPGGMYFGSVENLWRNPNYTDVYKGPWDWVENGEFYIWKFKFGRLTGLATIPSKWRSNEGYGGQVSFWTATCVMIKQRVK